MPTRTQITVVFDGKRNRVSTSSFTTVLSHTIGILNDLARTLSGEADPSISWNIVDAKMQSPLALTLAPTVKKKRTLGRRVVREYIEGVQAIQKNHDPPRSFSHRNLEGLKVITGTVIADGLKGVTFKSSEFGEVKPTAKIVENIHDIQRRLFTHEWSSHRGILEDIRTHGHENIFTIYDLLTEWPIDCKFAPEDVEKVGELIKRRVYVYGKTLYDRRGRPAQIEVEDFKALKQEGELTPLSEAPGIDITGGMDSVEFVRKIRNGEPVG